MTTWLDDERYAWIREHLAPQEDDAPLDTTVAHGMPEEDAPSPPLALDAPPPTTVGELIQRALDTLPPAQRAALEEAALHFATAHTAPRRREGGRA